jgi:transposase-like protein
MEQGSTTSEATDTGLFAGGAWFDPIEAGIRECVHRLIEELLEQELTAAVRRGRSERTAGEPKGYRNGTRGGSCWAALARLRSKRPAPVWPWLPTVRPAASAC